MNLPKFTGPGSTPIRRRFWDQIAQTVIASRKVQGRNVTVSEHPGKGTVINVARGIPAFDCSNLTRESITVVIEGITLCGLYSGSLDGTFTLANFGSGVWAAFIGEISYDGGDPDPHTEIDVFCVDGEVSITINNSTIGGAFFASAGGAPPGPYPNGYMSCSDGDGFGGTINIFQ
jgi:hypothetical protein